jgi:hypothetical protein
LIIWVFFASSFKRATPTNPSDVIAVGIQRKASYLILLEKVVLLRRSFEPGTKWDMAVHYMGVFMHYGLSEEKVWSHTYG